MSRLQAMHEERDRLSKLHKKEAEYQEPPVMHTF